MRGFLVLFGALTVLVLVGLSRPAAAAACTGCPEPLADLAHTADRIDLVEVQTATTSGGYVFRVEQVFKGPAATELRFPLAGALQTFPVGTRWILLLTPGHGLGSANAFAVEPDGRVLRGGPFDVPTTLAGWYATFGLPATDTADVAPTEGIRTRLLLTLAIVANLAGIAAWRRFASRP